MITDIEYCAADNRVYGTDNGERVEVVYEGDEFVMHPSAAWARAEQALLKEQRDAQIAREREERMVQVIDNVLKEYIPINVCSSVPGWRGSFAVRQALITNLRLNGYLE